MKVIKYTLKNLSKNSFIFKDVSSSNKNNFPLKKKDLIMG